MRSYFIASIIFLAGCVSQSSNLDNLEPPVAGAAKGKPFKITLFASEYPSWSTFGVACQQGLVGKDFGQMGILEKKWNVDLEIRLISYDACLAAYASQGGAVCITNVDIIGQVQNRPATAILPTSTSFGADACIGINGKYTIDAIKDEVTYGLERSVSDYVWWRVLEKSDRNPLDYIFTNRDPDQVAQALQTGACNVGQVWNPFVIQILRNKSNAKIIFDSTFIPDEVVDMIVIDNDTLHKSGGSAAAKCIMDVYYTICNQLKDKNVKVSDEAYLALRDQFAQSGGSFAQVSLEDMKSCVDFDSNSDIKKRITTRFYDTPKNGIEIFDVEHMKPIISHVLRWAKMRQIINKPLMINYGDMPGNAQLTFDPRYMQELSETW